MGPFKRFDFNNKYARAGNVLFLVLVIIFVIFRYFYLRRIFANLFKQSNEYCKTLTLRLRTKISLQLRSQFIMMVAAVILGILLVVDELNTNVDYIKSVLGKEMTLLLHISACAVVVFYTRIMLPILEFDLERTLERINLYKNGARSSPILKKDRPILIIDDGHFRDIIESSHPMDGIPDAEKTPEVEGFNLQPSESVLKIHDKGNSISLKISNDNTLDTPTTINQRPTPPSVNGSNSAISPNGTAILPKRVQFSPSITTILD